LNGLTLFFWLSHFIWLRLVLAPDLLDRHAGFCLPQKTNELLFAEFAWLACPSFSNVMDILEIWLVRFMGGRSLRDAELKLVAKV
jgi:hypothetical protein